MIDLKGFTGTILAEELTQETFGRTEASLEYPGRPGSLQNR